MYFEYRILHRARCQNPDPLVEVPLLLRPPALPARRRHQASAPARAAVPPATGGAGRSAAWIAALVVAADLLLRVQPFEHELDRRRRAAAPARRRPGPSAASHVHQALHPRRLAHQSVAGSGVVELAACRPGRTTGRLAASVGVVEVAVEDVARPRRGSARAHRVGALQLAFVLQLELAGDRRQRGVDVE